MYEIDPKPNSDQAICKNCETIVEKSSIVETIDGKYGCFECIAFCQWCGDFYHREDLYDNPFLGYVCEACENAEDYLKASKDEVLKAALRCYFDSSINKRIENEIIKITQSVGYNNLAQELKQDKS